jgi:hypothetical protein
VYLTPLVKPLNSSFYTIQPNQGNIIKSRDQRDDSDAWMCDSFSGPLKKPTSGSSLRQKATDYKYLLNAESKDGKQRYKAGKSESRKVGKSESLEVRKTGSGESREVV